MSLHAARVSRLVAAALVLVAGGSLSAASDDQATREAVEETRRTLGATLQTAEQASKTFGKALENYEVIQSYVSGRAGTEVIDRLYQDAGLEAHDRVTELRGELQKALGTLDRAGVRNK